MRRLRLLWHLFSGSDNKLHKDDTWHRSLERFGSSSNGCKNSFLKWRPWWRDISLVKKGYTMTEQIWRFLQNRHGIHGPGSFSVGPGPYIPWRFLKNRHSLYPKNKNNPNAPPNYSFPAALLSSPKSPTSSPPAKNPKINPKIPFLA